MADSSDQIKVVVRIRPLIEREQQVGQDARWTVQDEKLISQTDQTNLPPYAFDQVFDRDCTTWELYSCVIAPIVDAAMNGYHGTVFAYGQSGSGKTHTMSGDKMTPGVIAQAMNDIFEFIEQKPSHEFLMRASYMEIYNEKIYDLLSKEERHLKITENSDHQINVAGIEETLVHSCEMVLSVIQKGEDKRKFAETKKNDRSSRSHCIFRIIIESRLRNETNDAVMVSHLNFVDLAGSEKAGENSGDRFREGCSINLSLFCLSNVISKLSEGVGKQFLSYRDSKLTRILQNALGGNSKTVIVATINPTAIEESHSTLRFSTRAKTIKNKTHVNAILSDAAMLKKYRNQISELQKLVKEMDVADIQSANQDLKKRLGEKQELIEQLTKQIIVSSVTDKTTVQKKKMRRETWAAPKVPRKSFFPSLPPPPLNHQSVTIREETDLEMDLACSDDLHLPFTDITVSPDKSVIKAFLRKSDEMVFTDSLLTGGEMGGGGVSGANKDLEGEVQRLEEVLTLREGEHAEEVERLQERIKQLEYEQAVNEERENEEREKSAVSGQEDITALWEKVEHMQYECQLHLEENQLLQKNLWHAEESVTRLKQEASHLRDKRFDFSLQEWEELQTAKASLEVEMKQLVASLQQKDKDIEDLKKSLAGQDPYITRLEQQLEQFMGSSNGQLRSGEGGKRRSGIPVLLKSEGADSPNRVKAEEKDSPATSETPAVEAASKPTMVDCATSTDDLPQLSASHSPEGDAISSPLPSQSGSQLSTSALEPNTSTGRPSLLECSQTALKAQGESQSFVSVDAGMEQDSGNMSVSSKVKDVSFVHEGGRAQDMQNEDEIVTPEKGETTRTVFSFMESSAKIARQLKRRSDGRSAASPKEDEMSVRLTEQAEELEQVTHDNARLLEVLNQANVEIVRLKEVMEAMEQADAERMDELSELPKLQALLNRREMEIHRLESQNGRLKEDLNQQMLNSSVSSLSSSFSEPRRKSAMLKEREAEIWKLKDQIIQQARHIDDIQQKKFQLENMVGDCQTHSENENEQENVENERLSSCSSSPSSVPSSSEVNLSVREEEEQMEREVDHITVTLAEMETVQRMLQDKDSLITHLKNQLQEKEDEMEQMFEGQMLVSSDVIQTHLQQAEEQKDKVEMLEGQLKWREEEVSKLRARAELQHSSSTSSSRSSQGEDSSAFLEQLIMDKMAMEESLQEKNAELSQALEQREELQAQLGERQAMVNQLRQQHEDTTEVLLSTQEELIALKRFVERELVKDTEKQVKDTEKQENPCLEEGPLEDEQAKNASQSAEGTQESFVEEDSPATKGDESFEVSFKTQTAGNPDQHPDEASPDMEDEDEISFKTAGIETKECDVKNDSVDHIANYPSEPSKSNHQDDSFEISYKMKDTEAAMSDVTHLTERIESLEQRESELLEILKEKEQQIQSLMVLQEQDLNKLKPGADSEKDSKSSLHEDIATESTSNAADLDIDSTELPLEMQCKALVEEQKNLENRIQDAEAVIEEKTILEAKIQELLKVVDEKSSVISQLQKQCEETGSQPETMSLQAEKERVCLKWAGGETWAEEKERLLAKLEHLSQVEECLANNIDMLELSQEEKAALDQRVQDLEATLEELTGTEDKGGAEREVLEGKVEENISQLESAHTEVQQLRSENDHIISQKADLEREVQDLRAKVDTLQAEIEQTQDLKAMSEQFAGTEENGGAEKETLEAQMKENLTQLESARLEVQQLRSENGCIISQKTELESEVQDLKVKVNSLQAEVEQMEGMAGRLADSIEQNDALEKKVLELTGRMEELTGTVDQLTSEQEEVTAELTWQTKENEKVQGRVEELEAELEEQKQEAEDLVQELEKVQKLQEDSEHCQRVVEDTLDNFKAQNATLEANKHTLATERDEFELRAEAAFKEQERLKLDLKVATDSLQTKVSTLEMQLQTSEQRKQVLEAAVADRESAQHMGELLHDKLSVDLQESQTQVASMKTTLSQLQFELHSHQAKFTTLNKLTASMEAEKDHLNQDKAHLENERAELKAKVCGLEDEMKALQKGLASKQAIEQDKSSLEKEKMELTAKLSSLEDKVKALQKDLNSKQAVEQSKQALETKVLKQKKEHEQLQAHIDQLKQKVEAGADRANQLKKEGEEARASYQELSETVALLETRCMQTTLECGQMSHSMQQLQRAGEENEQRAASARAECGQLQEELGGKLEHIEQLQKELEALRASADSSKAGEKMVPLIEVKKQKFMLKNKIAYLTRDLEALKKVSDHQDAWIQELLQKLSKYENEEQEDKDEKIDRLVEEKKKLESDLKAKDLELVGFQMKQQDAITKLRKQLSHAEEMVTYKEQTIGKLKGEIRRIHSDEVSFCSSAAPKGKTPEPVKPERIISNHSGIIDRYTVTLLEADKYKLQKELKKTQERLQSRESELHWTKVALAKAKAGDGSSPTSPASMEILAASRSRDSDSKPERNSMPALMRQPTSGAWSGSPAAHHSSSCARTEQRSPLLERMGTSVDGGLTTTDCVARGVRDVGLKGAGDLVPRSGGGGAVTGTANSGSAALRTGGDCGVARTSRRRDDSSAGLQPASLSTMGTPVDLKKDRPVLPSAVDKENTPCGTDVLAAHKAAARSTARDVAGAESPINIEPEFWKKAQRPAVSTTYRSSRSHLMGKTAAANAEQCKTQ